MVVGHAAGAVRVDAGGVGVVVAALLWMLPVHHLMLMLLLLRQLTALWLTLQSVLHALRLILPRGWLSKHVRM